MATQQERLGEAIDYLTEDDGKKKAAGQVDGAVRVVERAARAEGLAPSQIDRLIDCMAGRGGSVSVRVRIVRSLIPQTTIPWSAAVKGLAHVRTSPLTLQQVMLRWLVLTFDLIDDPTPLHCLYTAIFYYLQVDDLRPTVCQLLCFLTQREDVTEFRVQKLVELERRVVSFRGLEAPLTALLLLYKSFCPHLLPGPLSPRRKVWFRPFEKALAADIRRVQAKSQGPPPPDHPKSTAINSLERVLAAPPPAKRARRDVPSIPTLAPPLTHLPTTDRVPVNQLSSVEELCDNITSLELPRQMAAVLDSSLLQHVLSVWSHDQCPALRLVYWLQHTLGYELDEYCPGSESPHLSLLLSRLADFTEFIQEPVPVVEGFLLIMFETWNGLDYKKDIFRLLSHLSLQPFQDLRADFLIPLKRIFVSSDSAQYKYDVIVCLTDMLRNLALLEWPRHHNQTEPLFSTTLTKSTEADEEDFNPLETIQMVVNYINHLILLALETGCGDHALLCHASLSYHELVVDLPVVYGIPLLLLPREPSIFNLLLSINAVFLSRICGLLVQCKENFTNLTRAKRDRRLTVTFNRVVLDFCDTLWRGLAFQSSPDRPYPTLLFQLTREYVESRGIHSPDDQLSIIHHPALLGYVRKFFVNTQPASSKLRPEAIWQKSEFKEAYLDYLSQCKLAGLVLFIRTFVRTRT